MRKALVIAALMIAACDRDRPPAPSAEQANQLDEAEAMLNEMGENKEGAAPAGTAPSNSN
jgi:hypothetical protein